MNCINIHGRLTRDPETKYYNGDKTVCKISVAVDRSFKDRDGNAVTDFFNCVCFGKRAEVIEKYFNKGDGISIWGEMQNNRYDDKDGNKRDGWQVQIEKFDFELSRKSDNAQSSTRNTGNANSPIPDGFYPIDENSEDEELPF